MSSLRRRVPLAVAASLGLHATLAAVVVGSSLWNAWRTPVDVEITGMSLEDLNELPLGAPAAGERREDAVVAPAPRSPPRRESKPDEAAAKANKADPGLRSAEETPNGGAAPPRPTSVRSYGPEGSRVTALLRVDRLRGTPYAQLVDDLLMNLPDRRDLFEGTGLDLMQDIDTLLIATPNPMDATVTFLAARHHLTDGALRAALERGARATGRRLAWRTERGRPFAERRPASASASAGDDGIPGAAPTRDRRLILLAAPSLVVVTPPAYRALLLQGRGSAAASRGRAMAPDGGAGGDAGAPVADRPKAAEPDDGKGWAALVRRIDAEDGIMPADAVALVSAADLFAARTLRPTLDAMPGTRGAVDEDAPAAPTVMGLPVPRLLTATLGAMPAPFANLDAEFAAEASALRWEEEWPRLRHKLLTNPLVVFGGFAPLIRRAVLERAGATVHVHLEATELETRAILNLLATQLTALRR